SHCVARAGKFARRSAIHFQMESAPIFRGSQYQMADNHDRVGRRLHTVRTLLSLTIAALTFAVVATAVSAQGGFEGRNDRDQRDDHNERDKHERGRVYAIGLWGDMPYSDTQALT